MRGSRRAIFDGPFLRFLNHVRRRRCYIKVCATLTCLNLIDQSSGDGPDSIRRAIHPLCWRCLLLCRGTGLHGIRQNSQACPTASASRANHPLQAKAIVRVCSRGSRSIEHAFNTAHPGCPAPILRLSPSTGPTSPWPVHGYRCILRSQKAHYPAPW
jgi:hypothetical protein